MGCVCGGGGMGGVGLGRWRDGEVGALRGVRVREAMLQKGRRCLKESQWDYGTQACGTSR